MPERSLVIIKPDAVNRGLIGELIHRIERKGLKIIGMKMRHLEDKELKEHYRHHQGKPFFRSLVEFMEHSPTVLMVIEGYRAIEAIRMLAGQTYGLESDPGTIRGDYSMSHQYNIIHASDSAEAAKKEIKRFFKKSELFSYKRIDWDLVYSKEDKK